MAKWWKSYRWDDNPLEKAFYGAWCRQKGILGHIMSTDNREMPVSLRDWEVAASVIQWLGSPVGQCFLRDLGYERLQEADPE